jgi:hypothetical protein
MEDLVYLILIIIFTFIVFLLCNNETVNISKNNSVTKDNFNDTDNIDVSDYINSNVNYFMDKKKHIDIMSVTPIIKDEPKYKYGLEIHNLGQDMNVFNTKLDMLMENTLVSTSKIKSNIDNNIKNIQENEENLHSDYVKYFHKIYNQQQDKLGFDLLNKEFSGFYDNDEIDKHNVLEGFESNDTSTEIKNANNLSLFTGKYFILPYQYKNFNNVYMTLTDNNVNVKYNPNKIYLLSFYLLGDKFLELEATIAFKNKTLFDEENDLITPTNIDLLSNIKGIILTITKTKPKETNNFKYINTINHIKNILKQLGIIPGNQLMFFLVDSKFDKTKQIKLNEKKVETIENDLYRLYNVNGTTLLHLTKKSIIDEPFASLLK